MMKQGKNSEGKKKKKRAKINKEKKPQTRYPSKQRRITDPTKTRKNKGRDKSLCGICGQKMTMAM